MALPEYEKRVNKLKELEKTNKYSFEEVFTGEYWVDDKPIYRKVINFGNLPNSVYKQVDINIEKFDKLIKLYGIAYHSSNGSILPLPNVHLDDMKYNILLNFNKISEQVIIYTGTDRTAYTETYIILEYTKSTN